MESGIKHFFRQVNRALANQQTHMSIYGNLPRPGLPSVLREGHFHLPKLEKLRATLAKERSTLSVEDQTEIALMGLRECLKKKLTKDFFLIGRKYWESIHSIKLAEFRKQPPEMQRLEALREISPPNINPAHRQHLARVVREEGAGKVFESFLKQELEDQLLGDFNGFLAIAAHVFLQCIPKWDVLDDLNKPEKVNFPFYKRLGLSAKKAGLDNQKTAGILDRYRQQSGAKLKPFRGRSAKSLSNTFSLWRKEAVDQRIYREIPHNLHRPYKKIQ